MNETYYKKVLSIYDNFIDKETAVKMIVDYMEAEFKEYVTMCYQAGGQHALLVEEITRLENIKDLLTLDFWPVSQEVDELRAEVRKQVPYLDLHLKLIEAYKEAVATIAGLRAELKEPARIPSSAMWDECKKNAVDLVLARTEIKRLQEYEKKNILLRTEIETLKNQLKVYGIR